MSDRNENGLDEAMGSADSAGAPPHTMLLTPVPDHFGAETADEHLQTGTGIASPVENALFSQSAPVPTPPPLAAPPTGGWAPRPVQPPRAAPLTRPQVQEALSSPAPAPTQTALPRIASVAASGEGGEVFAERYQIVEKLGEGGMGLVYRVQCLRLGKDFALKRMLSSIAHDEALRATFYQEARLASSLTHPNIVSIVDYGEDERHGAFMVMELAQGQALSKRLANGPMPTRTMTDVVLQIADALKHIHSKGIVHSDIKPDNILLHRAKHSDRRRWQVMLLDFGLASLRSSDETQSEQISGTPQYMAPERIQGAPPNPSHDIYALGILAYQLITGRLPFEGDTMSILKAHLHTEPPPFSAFLESDVDPRLEGLIFKAIAKNPQERHQNMAAFIYELRTLVDMLGLGRKRGGFKQVITSVSTVSNIAKDKLLAAQANGFNSARVPLAVVTVDGTIEAANPAFARFLGKGPNDRVLGETVANEHFTSLVPTLSKEIRRTRNTRERTTLAVQIPQQDYVAHLRISLVPADDGMVLITVQVDNNQ